MNLQTHIIKGFHWPRHYTSAVAIGWHVDGEAGPIGSDPKNKEHLAARSMGQYGVTTAMPRILDIHDDLDIPASFFIPAYLVKEYPELTKRISEASVSHEIAYHGYMHENVFMVTDKEEDDLFDLQVTIMQEELGRKCSGWSAPGWGVRENTLQNMFKHNFLYDSSLMEYDRPYILCYDEKKMVELPISMVLDDYEIYGASLYPHGGGVNATAEEGYQIYREEFDGLRAYGGLFTTTFHPCILGRPGRLMMLKRLLAYMKSFEDVWFATYEEIATYVKEEFIR